MRSATQHFALVSTPILVVVAALTCTITVTPFTGIAVPVLKQPSSLAVCLALIKMPSVNFPVLKCQNTKPVLHILNPLTFILIAILQQLDAISLFKTTTHFSLIVTTFVFFKKLYIITLPLIQVIS